MLMSPLSDIEMISANARNICLLLCTAYMSYARLPLLLTFYSLLTVNSNLNDELFFPVVCTMLQV